MAINFPNSPGIGTVYTDTTSGFSYQWDGTLWKSYSAASSSNIQILDDISGSFNGNTTTFALTIFGSSFSPTNAQQLRIVLGGVVQSPGVDYTVSTSNIIFTTAPAAGLTFSGISLGIAIPVTVTTIPDGTSTAGSFNVVGLLSAANLRVSGVSTLGITTVTNLYASGIVTASSFVGNVTGTASTASFATTSFGLSGTPNLNVGVVTATSFVGNVTGTATGLSGTPNITVTNATVNGTLSVGGTTVILNAATLQINDKDIVVGYTTDANNNDVSNDNTANHGGIAVASTVGSPLINIPLQVGVNSTPTTYKQLMWIKQGNYSGMGTDAWVSNYAVSIGNTSSVQNNSRLTVGTGFTVFDTYLDASSIDIRSKNISVSGIGTITDTRFQSVGEKTTLVNGNTVSLVYNTGGGNIAICTNASGDITLAVTGIPTDSSFNNTAISFSVCSLNTGTARSCTAVTLNGFNATIRWAGGSLGNATAGVTTTNGMDIYSFSGINTVGSASTTANYYVLGVVNGGFR